MIIAVINILIIILLLTGLIACSTSMKPGNAVYKGGFFFFLFSLLSQLYSLALPYSLDAVITYLQEKSTLSVGYLVYVSGIPVVLFNGIGLSFLVVYLLMGLSRKNSHGDEYVA